MNCERVRGRIPEYICQALEGEDLSVVEAHLRECPECRMELESFKNLDAQLQKVVPALWEEIEPSPQFMAQLKRIELDPKPESKPGIIDFLSGLWANHRTALATGLSVCLIILVMVAINPSFGSDDDDDEKTEIAARDTTFSSQSDSVNESATIPEAYEADDGSPLALKGPAGAQGDSDDISVAGSKFTPSATTPPTEEMPVPMPSVEEYSIAEGLNPEEITELANSIALADDEVQKYLDEQEPLSMGISFSAASNSVFGCNAPLVYIERPQDTDEPFIYVCVDVENSTVLNVTLNSTPPPPDNPPDPSPDTLPTPSPEPDPGS